MEGREGEGKGGEKGVTRPFLFLLGWDGNERVKVHGEEMRAY